MRHSREDIKEYIIGHYREFLFYSKFRFLIRKHIREQIVIRLNSMNPVCFDSGSCELCGCLTPALQMADKACDNPCYPIMLDAYSWKFFKSTGLHYEGETRILWILENDKFQLGYIIKENELESNKN